MSTMQKIADAVGVSKSTVSRALNRTGYVGEETRGQILRAAEALGYSQNLLAKNLSTQRSNCVGLVMANKMYNGHYFNEIVSFCATKLQERGLELLLADGKDSAEDEQAAIFLLTGLRCDAIILYPHFLTADDIDTLVNKSAIPILVVNRALKNNQTNSVCCDHEEDSRRVTQSLIQSGHRKLAFIAGNLTSPTAQSRLSGYKKALSEANVSSDDLVFEGDWSIPSGYQAMKQLLSKHPSLDAVIASNDDMAIGALRYLAEIGILVPNDISIIGFDDIPVSAFLSPSLSSVKPPTQIMLDTAINQLINIMDKNQLHDISLFNSDIHIRESVMIERL